MFNQEEFKGKFNEIKGEIKKKWGEVTDDELTKTRGNGEALLGVIQQKFGAQKEEIQNHLKGLKDRWFSKVNDHKSDVSDTVNSKIDLTMESLKKSQ